MHPRNLISVFVIRGLESIIGKLALDEISIFWLVSVAEETGLNLALSDTLKTWFLATRPISMRCKWANAMFRPDFFLLVDLQTIPL